MNHKVTMRSVFVLAVMLAVGSLMVRIKDEPSVPFVAPSKAPASDLARPLASYRVNEEKIEGGSDFIGANYRARVTEAGFMFGQVPESGSRFAAREFTVTFGAPRIEQGSLRLECEKGTYRSAGSAVAQIDRGAVTEEYVFENRRVEQIFRFPAPVAEGAMKVCIPVTSDLTGPVVTHDPKEQGFKEMQFLKGGIAFCDEQGVTKLAYHTAVAIDAEGRQIALAPRHENREIILEVPADFMAVAKYPVVVDPWLELGGSGTGGGVSANGSVSDRPQLRMTGGGLTFICWADNSAADTTNPDNYDIYLKYWNGFEFKVLGTSGSAGGISANVGKSTNPSMDLLSGNGDPCIAWQDDTGGAVHIQLRRWDGVRAGPWIEYGGSATPFGVSRSFGPALNPSVGYLTVLIRGDGVNVQNKIDVLPVVAWEETTNTSEIYCAFFFPGAPALSPPAPAGWYFLAFDGTFTFPGARGASSVVSVNTVPGVSQRPQLAVDDNNIIHVAWQDTSNGNYEIYCRSWGDGTLFEIDTSGASQSDVLPGTGWLETVAGSGSGGGISATAGASQLPAVAVDRVNIATVGLTIAWQESLPAAPPGTNNQIYLMRSLNYGAFGAISGSATGNGISQSVGSATNPAVDVNGGYISVAWCDDSAGNPEVYVRRSALPGGPWEQVGFQGSASPLIGADTVAPIDGVSKTTSLSLTPSVRNDAFGNPTVVWADGTPGSSFDILMRQFSPNGPGVAVGTVFTTTLRQTFTDPRLGPAIDIPVPTASTTTTVFLSADMFTEALVPVGTALRLEVEVKPTGGAFTGTPTATSLHVAPGQIAVVPFSGLPNFNYHWQARTVDQFGRNSPWIPFGAVGGVSFQVFAGGGGGGPTPPPIVVTTRGKGSCGLTGLEAVALLGVLALIRRKRAK